MSVTSESSPAVAADFVLRGASELVTMSAPPAEGLGAIAGGALAAKDGVIVWVGREAELPQAVHLAPDGLDIDAQGRCVLPGFVDAHTHVPFAGSRAAEYGERLAGVSYGELLGGRERGSGKRGRAAQRKDAGRGGGRADAGGRPRPRAPAPDRRRRRQDPDQGRRRPDPARRRRQERRLQRLPGAARRVHAAGRRRAAALRCTSSPSNFKRWRLDVFQGVSAAHLQSCLDEFCYRLWPP